MRSGLVLKSAYLRKGSRAGGLHCCQGNGARQRAPPQCRSRQPQRMQQEARRMCRQSCGWHRQQHHGKLWRQK